jgi:peptidoglycan/LPS O-acetylase OafA/YrhL
LRTAEKTRVFYPELESLRGLAALAVSLCHVFNSAQRNGTSFATFSLNDWAHFVMTSLLSSEGGVAIFFVLSGFVLSLQLGDDVTPRSWTAFAIRRIFRIFPAAWASVCVALLVLHFVHHQNPEWDQIANAFFLYDANSIPINPPLWSLSVELFISALLPLMVAANMRFSPIFQLIPLGMFYWISNIEGQLFFTWYLFAFQLGIMVPTGAAIIEKLNRWVAGLLLVVALIGVMSATNLAWMDFFYRRTQVHIEVFGAFYVVSYVYSRKSERLTHVLHLSPVRFLGRISYSMYVLNYPLLSWFWAMAGGPHPPFWLKYMLPHAAIFIAMNIAAAYISYRLFEAPFVRWGQQLSKRLFWRPLPPSAAPASSPAVHSCAQAAG